MKINDSVIAHHKLSRIRKRSHNFNLAVGARFKTRIMDNATGKCVKESGWQNNLIVDQGLNSWAGQSVTGLTQGAFPQNFAKLHIGSGTAPVKIASGAITFTQSGTTVTASGGFFTSAMVGGILKYGTGTAGVEYYITSFTDTTHVEVDTSATVGATVGTVWQVQTTALQTPLYSTTTYQTNAGDNSSTFNGTDTITFQRTFINPNQASSYNVNELGYSLNSATGGNVAGRIVLSSTDVVGTSNFYVVVLQITLTFSPATPTAVGNVGTNCNTAGSAMVEGYEVSAAPNTIIGLVTGINANGTTPSGNTGLFDFATLQWRLCAFTTDYTQKTTPSSIALTPASRYTFANVAWSKVVGVRGQMQKTSSASVTAAGESWYGIGLASTSGIASTVVWDVHFTTPNTLPTGLFQPITTITATFNRVLSN